MNDKTYPKWVGVILGFLLNGSAHYLTGQKANGIKWYCSIALAATAALLILAVPGVVALAVSATVFLVALALWLTMLKQSYRPVPRIRVLGWITIIAFGLLLNFGWKYVTKQLVHPFKIPSSAMIPSIMPGDHFVAERISYKFMKPKRGDVVVFSTTGLKYPQVRPGDFFIKRIAGLPGETIQIAPPNLIVNGQIVKAPEIFTEISARSNGFLFAQGNMNLKPLLSSVDDKIVLGEHEYLTLGDNTKNSLDGRYYGPIKENQIFGRVSRIYWPLSRIGK